MLTALLSFVSVMRQALGGLLPSLSFASYIIPLQSDCLTLLTESQPAEVDRPSMWHVTLTWVHALSLHYVNITENSFKHTFTSMPCDV